MISNSNTQQLMKRLVDNLVKGGVITQQRVADAMIKVDRGHFCENGNTSAYDDCP